MNRMKQRFIILIPLICSIILSGCWDSNEPERLVYANGIGIDYKNDKIILYVQIINLQGLTKSKSGGGNPMASPADVGTATGKTIEEALFNLYHATDRRIYWGHLSFIIFTEDAIKKHSLKYMLDFFHRYREFRYRIYCFLTKDAIQDVMLTSPIDNISMVFSKLSDPQDNYNQSSFIPPINLRELIIKLDEPDHQVMVPMIKVTKQWSGQKEKRNDLLLEKVAILTQDTLQGILPKHIQNGARLVNEKFTRDILPLFPNSDNSVGALIYDKKYKVIPVFESKDRIRFIIKMKLRASIILMKQDTSMKEYEDEIKKVVTQEVHSTYLYTQKKNIDIFRLSESIYKNHNDIWKKIEKNGQIPLNEDTIKSIEVEVNLQDAEKQKLIPIFYEEKNQ